MALLTLQYPDAYEGRLRILASTHDKKVLLAFKKAVLQDAELKTLGFIDDEVLRQDAQFEYERLKSLLDLLIREEGSANGQ